MKALLILILLFPIMALATSGFAFYPDGYYEVGQVVDGDTFDLTGGQRVRLIGINAPEIGEECSEDATQALESLISGQRVYLVSDVSDTDSDGTLLRYVYVGDTFVNYELVYQGFAYAEERPPDLLYASDLNAAEDSADRSDRGCLWEDACPSGIYVYISFTGTEFHKAGCPNLSENNTVICYDDAVAQGYTPCPVCCKDTHDGTVVVVGASCFVNSAAYGSHIETGIPNRIVLVVVIVLTGGTIGLVGLWRMRNL
jgi:endonuclease YncB( thermonuclease family)